MSKVRTLFPESESSVTDNLTPKLEKALALCEILQSSSEKSKGVDGSIFSLPDFPHISYEVNYPENDFKKYHFQVYNKAL